MWPGLSTQAQLIFSIFSNFHWVLLHLTCKLFGSNIEGTSRGFLVTEGKIVQDSEPPATIKPFSSGTFSASGREGSAVAPKGGRIFILL